MLGKTRMLASAAIALGALMATQGTALAQSTSALEGPEAAFDCDRACLTAFVDNYAAAMISKDTSAVPLAADAVVSENGQPIELGEGVWATSVQFYSVPSNTQYVIDTQSGQAVLMGVLDIGDGVPAMYAVRLKVEGDRISEIETLVRGENDGGGAFIPEGFLYREGPYVRDVPLPIRSSRAELLDLVGRYWEEATTTHLGRNIPYSVDCVHFENGMNTRWERPLSSYEEQTPEDNPVSMFDGRIWTCERELDMTTRAWSDVRQPHYVIDEERGLIMTWALVGQYTPVPPIPTVNPDGTPATPPPWGPATRGSDGWPMRPRGGAMPAPGAPGSGGSEPGAGNWPGPRQISKLHYFAALQRVVRGSVHRQQFFRVAVPEDSELPY